MTPDEMNKVGLASREGQIQRQAEYIEKLESIIKETWQVLCGGNLTGPVFAQLPDHARKAMTRRY